MLSSTVLQRLLPSSLAKTSSLASTTALNAFVLPVVPGDIITSTNEFTFMSSKAVINTVRIVWLTIW